MAEDEKRQDEDTEGNMPLRLGVGNEESDVEDAEGHRRQLGNEESDVEDDVEGHHKR
jgi:hypothetical protein